MLQDWLKSNNINFTYKGDSIYEIPSFGNCLLLSEKESVFDESLCLCLTEEEEKTFNLSSLSTKHKINYLVFKLGDNYYYNNEIPLKELNILKYVGENTFSSNNHPFLGIHGNFDLLNGSGSYKDWCKKAKFLKIDTLGICEKNTLSGAMKFQMECLKSKITPIIGMQVNIKDGSNYYLVKCYVINEWGWDNILRINKAINVDNPKFIAKKEFLEYTDGLIIVLDPKCIDYDFVLPYTLNIESNRLFWQLDSTEYINEGKDKEYLINLKSFITDKKYNIQPVLITDAYYLDKEDSFIKVTLNNISEKREYKSNNQYFKTSTDVFNELSSIFSDTDKLSKLLNLSVENLLKIKNLCKFNILTTERRLPEYILDEEEQNRYGDKTEMLYCLIEEGMKKKGFENNKVYLDRLDEELNVIVGYKLEDYFLSLWRIVKYAKENNILVGVARGSSGGCLVTYCLGITELDPIHFNLLFSRFLNEGRLGKKEECEKIILIGENGEKKEYWQHERIPIIRNGIKIVVNAEDLQENDILP